MTIKDFNHTTGRRRTIKKPNRREKNPTTRKKRNKMIFKKKKTRTRPPKHINCRGGLKQTLPKTYWWQRQHHHQETHGQTSEAYQLQRKSFHSNKTHTDVKAHQAQRHPHLSHKRSIIETLQQPGSQQKVTAGVSSGGDTNAEDIGTPHTKITETSLHKRFKC